MDKSQKMFKDAFKSLQSQAPEQIVVLQYVDGAFTGLSKNLV